jgi:hypothetical protein
VRHHGHYFYSDFEAAVKITFDDDMAEFVLHCVGLCVCGGFVCDLYDHPVMALDGKPVRIKEFAGVVKTDDGKRLVRKGLFGALDLLNHRMSDVGLG